MPSRAAASSTLGRRRAAARPTGLAGPEGSAPPPNGVFAGSGTSTPISNRVFLSARLRAALEAPPPVGSLTTTGPQREAGHDEAHARADRGTVHALVAAAVVR